MLRAALGAFALIALLCHAVPALATEVQLEGAAYTATEEAYKSFEKGDYKTAAARAAQAVALRPDMLRLQLLLIDSLLAAGDLEQAAQATSKAAKTLASNQEIQARQASIRQRQAQGPAAEGYKALERGDAKAAISAARSAVEYAPDSMSYRLLLLSAQLADSNLADAITTTNEAIKLDPGNYVPVVWRGYVHQRLGNRAAAVADFDAALAIRDLTEVEQKNIRIIAADAALASGDYAAAQKLLANYSKSDPAVARRLDDAEAAASGKGTLKTDGKNMPMPAQDCRPTPYGSVCSLEAPVVLSQLTPVDKAAEGFEAARKAFSAARSKNYKLAIAEARKAVEASPEVASHRLLLINLLITASRPGEAEAEATRLIDEGGGTGEVYAQRGYARNLLKNESGANSDWQAALQRGLTAKQAREVRTALANARMSEADAALLAKQPQRALNVLEKLPESYDNAIRQAYALEALDRKEESLAAFRVAEKLAVTGTQRDGALAAEINTLLELKRKEEARAMFDAAISRGRLWTIADADVAYMAVAVGNDPVAMARFDRSAHNGQLPPRATIDAGYTAMRTFDNKKALAYLKEGIDAAYAGRIDIDEQKLFETRRTVADLSREWGINSSISYGKVGSAPNPFLTITGPSSATAQFGTEVYYRPEGFGNRNGALFEVFGRLFETLYDQVGGPTGLRTTQGMVGARWKPFSDHNLVFEIDRLIKLGDTARNDTLLRAAYSYTVGQDLRMLESSWPTWYIYGEVDRFLENRQTVALAEGRFGRSFRLDPISRNLVLFPHVVAAASYDSSYAIRDAYSAGVGASLRYWFGETKYMAPPSYWEATLQYRFRLGGDRRAEGIFAQTSLNY